MTNQPNKSYENLEFLNSHDARPIRVLCELIEPATRLAQNEIKNTIVFFGSARSKPKIEAQEDLNNLLNSNDAKETDILKAKYILKLSEYYDRAVILAEKLASWSQNNKSKYYICSGGGPGMMEAANRGAHKASTESIALGISLPFEQGVNQYASPELSFEFHYFFIRKFYFLYHAKAVVVFPGGFGTMDELFETLTLIQTGKLQKKVPIYLIGRDFWEGLINFTNFVEWGVISADDLSLFKIIDDTDDAYETITRDLEENSK